MSDAEGDDSLFVSEADLRREAERKSEDVNMTDASFADGEDPVVQDFPVYFANSLADKLYLLQYPSRSMTYPLVEQNGSGIMECRLKPESGILEVDIPINTQRFYDQDKGERWNKVHRQTMGGVLKDPQQNVDGSHGSRYMVGVFKNEELHLTPIKAVAQLRPQFKYIDKEALAEKEIVKNVNAQTAPKKGAKVVQMSAKATGEAAPRYSGALATRKQADEEAFVNINWFDRDCDESWRESDRLEAVERQALMSKTTIDDYITELQR